MWEIGEGVKISENVWCIDLGDDYMSVYTCQNPSAVHKNLCILLYVPQSKKFLKIKYLQYRKLFKLLNFNEINFTFQFFKGGY